MQPTEDPLGGPEEAARLIPGWPGVSSLVPDVCTVYRVGAVVQVWALGSMVGQQHLRRGRPVGEFVLAVPALQVASMRIDLRTGDVQGLAARGKPRRVSAGAGGGVRRSRR
ncbi:hypothetical protein ACSDR0_48920 [Streptosporangium sp. G11]|uniref:hypothetical protein n=1 Tax=Streptosporangium sp. G11 TaxID=3436926 RepID=UPI003EBB3741